MEIRHKFALDPILNATEKRWRWRSVYTKPKFYFFLRDLYSTYIGPVPI